MSLFVISRIDELRETLSKYRDSGRSIGLVPTMGALHDGHAQLIRTAAAQCHTVVVSIFVNPLQFGPAEDYGRYPRPIEADQALCERLGVELLFVPEVKEIYPSEQMAVVDLPEMTKTLCGASRPGHFRGVLTVVQKLLNIVQPQRAFFGEKDMQQLAVIHRMVRDLNVPAEIVGVATVREVDGLALSSRNRYLDAKQRSSATVLYRALEQTAKRIQGGETDAARLKQAARQRVAEEPGVRLEYFELVDDDMRPVQRISGPVHAAGAIWLGSTRLIDNILCP